MIWLAHDGAQEEFLQRTEFEVLFGGMAGPGKTAALIAAVVGIFRILIIKRSSFAEPISSCRKL